jgi:hypothetical protein
MSSEKVKLSWLMNSLDIYAHEWLIMDLSKDGKTLKIGNTYYEEFNDDVDSIESIPHLKLSLQNYQNLQLQYNQIIASPEKYLIIIQNDNGLIELCSKQNLSEDDLTELEKDKQHLLRYLETRK